MDRIAASAMNATRRPKLPTPSTVRSSARRSGAAASSPTSLASSWCVAAWHDRRRTRIARSARMVAAEVGRIHPGHRREARQLGAAGMGPIAENARVASLDSMGRRVGVDPPPGAGGFVAPWHREVSGRAHYSAAAQTWLTTSARQSVVPLDDGTAAQLATSFCVRRLMGPQLARGLVLRAEVGVTSAPNTTTAMPRAMGDFLLGTALRYPEKKPIRDCDSSDFVFDSLCIPAVGGCTIRVYAVQNRVADGRTTVGGNAASGGKTPWPEAALVCSPTLNCVGKAGEAQDNVINAHLGYHG